MYLARTSMNKDNINNCNQNKLFYVIRDTLYFIFLNISLYLMLFNCYFVYIVSYTFHFYGLAFLGIILKLTIFEVNLGISTTMIISSSEM